MASESLYLTILRQGDTITVDLTEVNPVVPRSQVQIEEGLLAEISEELARITTLANRSAILNTARTITGTEAPDSSHMALQRLGALIFSHLFPAPARQRLARATSTDLFLRLDDQLVHVPWELAFDGSDFLLARFRIGRQVITHYRPSADHAPRPQTTEPLRMLIIVDPTETLDAATAEAEQLCDMLDACSNLEVSLLGGKRLRKLDLLQALNECDLVHYAGHASFDPAQPGRSGWLLHEAVLTASELARVARPPLLVFSNACQAGATSRWQSETVYEGQAFGIGSAFLLAGVQNYIGTFCVIHDAYSAAFAADFYRHLLQGECLGAALATARRTTRQEIDPSGLLWASYMHYGNPTFRLPLTTGQTVTAPETAQHTLHVSSAQAAATAGVGLAEPPPASPAAAETGQDTGIAEPDLAGQSANIAELLRRRDEIDALLQQKFRREGTFLFTDMQGSTAYFEQHGDLSGRLLVQRHNDLLFPIIAAHQGTVLKTIGDAIMAWFAKPAQAVRVAIAMQRALHEANQGLEPAKQIHIRIGINSGQAYVETSDAFGDVVNVAARVVTHALPDQILITATTYQQLPGTLACSFLETTQVRGRTAPVALYEVHWGRTSRLPMATAHETAAPDARPHAGGTPALEVVPEAAVADDTPPQASGDVEDRWEVRRTAATGRASLPPETPPAPEEPAVPPADVPAATRRLGGWKQRLAVAAGVGLVLLGLLAVFWLRQSDDAWTSRPLTLALFPLERKGLPSAGAGADELVESHIVQVLQTSGRIKVVERAILEKLLAELKLGTSDLVDPQAALRVGRLLAARLIATGSVKYVGEGMQLSLRVIETETTDTPATAAETINRPDALDGVVATVSRNILQRLRQAYPLQGRITHITPQGLLLLNIGAQHGVTPGLTMLVFGSAEPLQIENPIAQIVITHVEARSSQAQARHSILPLRSGWRVREGQAK
jgi:class 3 adenylate cyclase/CHAT domain-containing protein